MPDLIGGFQEARHNFEAVSPLTRGIRRWAKDMFEMPALNDADVSFR